MKGAAVSGTIGSKEGTAARTFTSAELHEAVRDRIWKGDFHMAFFEDLTKKAKNVAAVAADKAKDAAEITKLTVAISGEQREIDKNYRAIGEWYVNEYEGEIPGSVRDLVEAVAASKAKIAELEAAKVAAKENGPAVEVADTKVCPICGAEAESKFCPQCGAPMGD